jgi:hypothetical protein
VTVLLKGFPQQAESSAQRTLNSFRGQLKYGHAGYCMRAHSKAVVQPKDRTVAGIRRVALTDPLKHRVYLFELYVALDGFVAVRGRKLG